MPQQLFKCKLCGLEATYEVFGRTLPQETVHSTGADAAKPTIAFLEDGYLRQDPFAARRRPLFLGAPCAACAAPVCAGRACSLFYTRRFCAACARAAAAAFPPELLRLEAATFGSQGQGGTGSQAGGSRPAGSSAVPGSRPEPQPGAKKRRR